MGNEEPDDRESESEGKKTRDSRVRSKSALKVAKDKQGKDCEANAPLVEEVNGPEQCNPNEGWLTLGKDSSDLDGVADEPSEFVEVLDLYQQGEQTAEIVKEVLAAYEAAGGEPDPFANVRLTIANDVNPFEAMAATVSEDVNSFAAMVHTPGHEPAESSPSNHTVTFDLGAIAEDIGSANGASRTRDLPRAPVRQPRLSHTPSSPNRASTRKTRREFPNLFLRRGR